ncbi:serine hydrolase domain-containing protein [Pseudarthrobacter sp. P1]|uniref:serine hydrolase domain-containing protein n=1 Tax=Pseudarthrobacter sp. P1 TaxID=3418418 RepID=UPI003CEAFCD1
MAARGAAQRIEGILSAAVAGGVAPSAVCAVALHGERLPVVAVGDAVRYAAAGADPAGDAVLPAAERVPATPETLYDLASVTKLFTTIAALALVDGGTLALDEPVGAWLPAYRSGAKASVTLRHLLTHTAGLPAEWDGWRAPLAAGAPVGRAALVADLLSTPLESTPGTRFSYSCTGFNTVMALAEAATPQPWAARVRARVLDPLGTGAITGTPSAQACAATEDMPGLGRGMVCGVVHDEAAWQLGGVSGNAGLFASAPALLDFTEALRTGLDGILSPALAEQMWENQLPRVLGPSWRAGAPGWHQGLGLRIGQLDWMGKHGGQGRGHGGFTGTSLLVDRAAGSSAVVLANRVHPNRGRSDATALRVQVSEAVRELSRGR